MTMLIAFFEKGEERQLTINCPASYMLVIRRLRVLNRKILWRAEVIAGMCSVLKKGVGKRFALYTGKKPALESLFNKVTGLQRGTSSNKETRYFPVNFSKFMRQAFLSTPPTTASGRALNFTKNGANNYCYLSF